jgi:hypothetical protein
MPNVFISYSSHDGILARQFHDYMAQHGIESFLAEISIQTGAKWKDSIIEALAQSKWVFFLATPAACASTAVMHEIGGALFGKKELITVMCGVDPQQLPDWIQDTQAINLSKQEEVIATIQRIAGTVRSDKFAAGLVAGGLLAFGLWALSEGKK